MIRLPAATFTDPWGPLAVSGIKTLETRKGPLLSGFQGVLVIHRSLAPCADAGLERWGLSVPPRPEGWPTDDRGMMLGVVFVGETSRPKGRSPLEDLATLQRRACFVDIEDRYLTDLLKAAWFPAPLSARGRQSRFMVEVPRAFLPDWALSETG